MHFSQSAILTYLLPLRLFLCRHGTNLDHLRRLGSVLAMVKKREVTIVGA